MAGLALLPIGRAVAQDCQAVDEDAARLRCYDEAARRTGAPPDTPPPAAAPPALAQRLEKERDLARRAFAIVPHRPNYVLHTYSGEPNVAPFQATAADTDFQHQEIKFQISLRVPLWNKMFGENGDLWFAYTQQSFWQAYYWDRSAPFRETDHEPELGLSFRTDFAVLGLRHRLLSAGFAHQSNGRDGPLSRSWNRLWLAFLLERGNFALGLRPWYRIPEDAATDDNPDLQEYAGRAELRAAYKYREQVFALQWRNNLQGGDNRSGYEINWSFPFSKRIKALVQYYNGYGESLIDYDVRNRRLGVGLLVEDWL